MGCSCNKKKRAAPLGSVYRYTFTPPGEEDTQTFLTAMEAKKAVRRAGGGTVRRITTSA